MSRPPASSPSTPVSPHARAASAPPSPLPSAAILPLLAPTPHQQALPPLPTPRGTKYTFWSLFAMLDPRIHLAILVVGFFCLHVLCFGIESVPLHDALTSAAPELATDTIATSPEPSSPPGMDPTVNATPSASATAAVDPAAQPSAVDPAAQPSGATAAAPGTPPEGTAATATATAARNLTACEGCIEPKMVPQGLSGPPMYVWRQLDETAAHCYTLGDKSDKHCVYRPLCMDKTERAWFTLDSEHVCSGFNKSEMTLRRVCPALEKDTVKESNLESTVEARANESLAASEAEIVWVEGTTLFQILDRSCGNIAHYAGRIFYLHHILSNFRSYYLKSVDNVVILPGEDTMKRFIRPAVYGFWHKHVLESIVYPAVPSLSGQQLLTPPTGDLRVSVLTDLNLGPPTSRYVCFRQAVITGFFKGRFFVVDHEIPSVEPSWASTSEQAPHVPRDALKFRSKVFKHLRRMSRIPRIHKRIVFLDREGLRRSIVPESKEKLFEMLRTSAAKRGYTFESVLFEGMTAREQINVMSDCAIAIGIHGAQMVNSIFMPPFSVLFELFPYSFYHDMYVEGGRAGLKYMSYTASQGEEWPQRQAMGFARTEDCIHRNRECKVFYRDQRTTYSAADFEALTKMLDNAFAYIDSLVAE